MSIEKVKEKNASLLKAGFIITALVIFSKMFGFIRETFIANYFGIGKELDIFLLSLLVSGLIAGACKEGLNNTIIPVLAKYIDQAENAQVKKNIIGNIFLACAIVLIIICVIGIMLSPYLAQIFSNSLSPESIKLLIILTEISFVSVIFSGLNGLLTGTLNYFGSFAIPAASGIFLNLSTIFILVLMHKNWGIYSLAFGALLGSIGPVVWMSLAATGKIKIPLKVNFKHPAVKTLGILMLPLIIGNAVDQINFLVARIFAAGLPEGSISALNYATKIVGLPITIFASAISTVIFPAMAKHAANNNKSGLYEMFSSGLRIAIALCLPTTMCLFILREPLVRILFERGAFTAADTSITALAFSFYLLGLFAYVAKVIAVRTLYSFQAMRTTVVVGAINVIINIIFILLLVKSMGIAGLALATSLATIIELCILLYVLHKRFDGFREINTIINYLKILGALILMGLGSIYFYNVLELSVRTPILNTLIKMTTFTILSFSVYALVLKIFKFPDIEFLINKVKSISLVKKS